MLALTLLDAVGWCFVFAIVFVCGVVFYHLIADSDRRETVSPFHHNQRVRITQDVRREGKIVVGSGDEVMLGSRIDSLPGLGPSWSGWKSRGGHFIDYVFPIPEWAIEQPQMEGACDPLSENGSRS